MNIRNLFRTILFMALSFLPTSFASEVKELIESPIRLDNPLYQLNGNNLEEKMVVLKDEKKNDDRCISVYMSMHKKYLYLKQNGLLIPVLLALESLTYDIIAPQENPHICHPLDEGNVYLNYGGSQYNIIRLFPTMLVQFWVGYIYTMTCLYFEAFK